MKLEESQVRNVAFKSFEEDTLTGNSATCKSCGVCKYVFRPYLKTSLLKIKDMEAWKIKTWTLRIPPVCP